MNFSSYNLNRYFEPHLDACINRCTRVGGERKESGLLTKKGYPSYSLASWDSLYISKDIKSTYSPELAEGNVAIEERDIWYALAPI